MTIVLARKTVHGDLGSRVLTSLKVLLSGYAIGIVLATILAVEKTNLELK